jgi:hypothetical protein
MISEAAMGAAVGAVCVLVSIEKDGGYCAVKTHLYMQFKLLPVSKL